MMRKPWLAPLFAAFTAASGLALATPAAAQTTLKMAYALSTSSHYGAGGEAFSKSLEAGTGGRYKVQQFPSSALGGERERRALLRYIERAGQHPHGGGLGQTVLLHEPREEFCRTHTGKAAPLRLRHADVQRGAVESEL